MLATVAIWARGLKSSRYGIVSHNLVTNIFLQIKILLLEIRNFIYIEKKKESLKMILFRIFLTGTF